MIATYHAHTWRCKHATGTEREYIEEAIRGGMRILGFSDHAPMPFPATYQSNFRMGMEELADYCETLQALRREYEKDIEIHIGLEAEYYPEFFEPLLKYLEDYPIEYLILGQHCLNNEYDGVGSSTPTEDPEFLKRYVDQCICGMKSGRFLYVAHPDIVRFNGDKEVYRREMMRLCQAAVDLGLPLEINLQGLMLGRNYPDPAFWQLAGEVGNDVVLGVDCHHKDKMILPEEEKLALQMVKYYGLSLRETFSL